MLKFLITFFILFFFNACGYRPAIQYTKATLGNSVYVNVSISRKDPRNSVLITDAVNESVITRFGVKLSQNQKADSKIFIRIGSISFSPILYNKRGYITAYKTKLELKVRYISKKGKSESFSTFGEYDFAVLQRDDLTTNSVISNENRFKAIKFASLDALNELVSKVTIKGMK